MMQICSYFRKSKTPYWLYCLVSINNRQYLYPFSFPFLSSHAFYLSFPFYPSFLFCLSFPFCLSFLSFYPSSPFYLSSPSFYPSSPFLQPFSLSVIKPKHSPNHSLHQRLLIVYCISYIQVSRNVYTILH